MSQKVDGPIVIWHRGGLWPLRSGSKLLCRKVWALTFERHSFFLFSRVQFYLEVRRNQSNLGKMYVFQKNSSLISQIDVFMSESSYLRDT